MGHILEETAWVDRNIFLRVLVREAEQEEGNVVFPGNSTISGQVNVGEQVAITVSPVGHKTLVGVRQVVHCGSGRCNRAKCGLQKKHNQIRRSLSVLTVPAVDDTAETERALYRGDKLVLAHDLSAEDTVDVDTCDSSAIARGGPVYIPATLTIVSFSRSFSSSAKVFGASGVGEGGIVIGIWKKSKRQVGMWMLIK